jgi:hypothetical protein
MEINYSKKGQKYSSVYTEIGKALNLGHLPKINQICIISDYLL